MDGNYSRCFHIRFDSTRIFEMVNLSIHKPNICLNRENSIFAQNIKYNFTMHNNKYSVLIVLLYITITKTKSNVNLSIFSFPDTEKKEKKKLFNSICY